MQFRGLALLACVVSAFAQNAAAPKPAVVEGKVVNSITNEPVRKADLTLSNSLLNDETEAMEAAAMFGGDAAAALPAKKKVEKKSFKVSTDSAGKFRFESVEPGDYYLTATHAGFVDEHYKPASHQGAEGMLHLTAGDELSGIGLRMTPHGAVSGRVQDEDGDPVPNAMVIALSYTYFTGRRKLGPSDSTTTNDRGEFRLGKLPPGRYFLTANALKMDPFGTPPPPPKDGSPEIAYVTTYYPSTTDVSQASKVDVAAGGDLSGFNIQIRKSRVARIKGQALAADGTPMKGGQVMLMNTASMGSMQMTTIRADGRFELANVQPGAYVLMTMQMGAAQPSMDMHMQPLVVPEAGLTDVKAGVLPQKTIPGRIVNGGESKIAMKGLTVMLSGDEDAPVMPVMATADESGAFTLKVASGSYDLRLSGNPPDTYVKSVAVNGRDMLGKPIDFSSGASDLAVTLASDGGQVKADVSLSDKPLFDATVVLLPADPSRRFPEASRFASTDETGKVTLKNVPPGKYLALAWEKIEEGEWFDPDLLKTVEKQAVSVEVSPKSTGSITLKAIPRI